MRQIYLCTWVLLSSLSAAILSHRGQPLPKLGRSQIGTLALTLDGIELHFIREGFLGREDMISVEIGIHHCDYRFFVGHITDGRRNLGHTEALIRSKAAVSGYDLKATFVTRTNDDGR